jgi:hypothetical protein
VLEDTALEPDEFVAAHDIADDILYYELDDIHYGFDEV